MRLLKNVDRRRSYADFLERLIQGVNASGQTDSAAPATGWPAPHLARQPLAARASGRSAQRPAVS
jgi:hypothetical protein